jgi:hypothetical protein
MAKKKLNFVADEAAVDEDGSSGDEEYDEDADSKGSLRDFIDENESSDESEDESSEDDSSDDGSAELRKEEHHQSKFIDTLHACTTLYNI